MSMLRRQITALSVWLAPSIVGIIVVAAVGAIALLPLKLALGLVVGCFGAALALAHPAWAVSAALMSVPLQELVPLPGGLSATQAALLLLVGSWAMFVLTRPERPLRLGGQLWVLSALVWALGLSAAFSPYSQIEGLKETLRWATVLLIAAVSLNVLDNGTAPSPNLRNWILLLIAALLLAPAATAIIGVRQFLSADAPPSFLIAGGRFARAYGTIGQPNSFAGYMNMAWPLAAGLLIWALPQWRKPLPLAVIATSAGAGALSGLGLVTSFSRGGWIGGIGGGLMLALGSISLLPKNWRRRVVQASLIGMVLGAGVLGAGAGGLLPNALAERIGSITRSLRIFDVRTVSVTPDNFAVVERMAHLQAAWEMFQRHPLTGVGAGNYTLGFEDRGDQQRAMMTIHPWYSSRGHAHNYYLHMLAEAGVVGLGSYVLWLGTLVWTWQHALRRARGWLWRGLAVGCGGVIGAVATHNIFENLHVLNMGLQLGVVWALLILVARYGDYPLDLRPTKPNEGSARPHDGTG